MNFIIDTEGETNLVGKSSFIDSDDEFDIQDLTFSLPESSKKSKPPRNSQESELESLDAFMGWSPGGVKNSGCPSEPPESPAPAGKPAESSSGPAASEEVAALLEKAVVRPGFEQLEAVPRYDVAKRRLALERRREREKTKGAKWFHMSAPELTPELKHDLQVLQMRSALDPKHFYKKNDRKALPKFFQVGKVLDSPLDFFGGRVSNKDRKKTLVDELMADADFARYNKKKFQEIVKENSRGLKKAHAHAKRLKKRK